MRDAYFNSRDLRCKSPFGASAAGKPVTFTLYLPKDACATHCSLHLKDADGSNAQVIPMTFHAADYERNAYRCVYTPERPSLTFYRFELCEAAARHTLGRGEFGVGKTGSDPDWWQLTVYDPDMRTPACLQNGTMYQIFPDRFFSSGTQKRDVPGDRMLRPDWDGVPIWQPNALGKVTNSDYFCGDLAGIEQKLDYLESLGVTAIYLNPIFEAHSNHRYNTADYHKIDPLLGDEEDFRRLCAAARERGIAVILDGVFSHTGSDSVYFNREGRYGGGGAFNDRESPCFPWYRFERYPDKYDCWWGFDTLPNVEETNPGYLDFICGEEGVVSHWMKNGAAGFRLDVADELPDIFLDTLYERVKRCDENGAVIGEVWEDASNKISYGQQRRYLLGGQMDSVMNYPFREALLRYMRFGGGQDFYERLMVILENYPPPVINGLMNSLSTHDSERAITALGGEAYAGQNRAWQSTRQNLSEERYWRGRHLFALASILQFGLPGIPCVYYGDEAGMCGYKDPFNRLCYPWGAEDQGLIGFIATLGRLRKRYPIFADASFEPLTFSDEVAAFVRRGKDTAILFAVNRSDTARMLSLPPEFDGAQMPAVYGGYENGTLLPVSGVVLLAGYNTP